MNKYYYYFILFLIISSGIYLRFYYLGFGSFWIDEGFSSIISYYSSLNNFIPILPSGNYNFSQYIFTILQTLSFNLLRYNDFSARIPSFIFGIFNIILFYFFSKGLLKDNKYEKLGTIFLVFLFTFSTWQIIWSREARFYELLSFICLFSFYFLWKYLKEFKNKYFIIFLSISIFGTIFHPFCLILFLVGVIIFIIVFLKDLIVNKNIKETFNKNYTYISTIIITFFIYFFVINLLHFYIYGKIDLLSIFPDFTFLSNSNIFSYLYYYINILNEQLGIILIFFIFGSIYSLIKKEYYFFSFFILITINLLVISMGNTAHSRYLFHILSIITLIGGYYFFIFIMYLFEYWNYKLNKSYLIIIIFIFILLTIITFKFTFLPQKFYYIDDTSPKPNFKMAYDFLKNKENLQIISGFPHLCYWYNLDNKNVCKYALKVNLTGSIESKKALKNQKNDFYTNVEFLDNFDKINLNDYYFVLDSLTLKNIDNIELLNNIKNNCNMIYRDLGDSKDVNFIGIWKCNK